MCNGTVGALCVRWRLWLQPIVGFAYLLFVIIAVPLLIVNSVKDGFSRKDQLILIGGLFVLSAIPVSIWQITQHIIHFTKPVLQKHIIRILWMVPIYALNAMLCLIYPHHAIYMDSIRECYEAYVIYNFMKYLLNYLNLEMDLVRSLEFKPAVSHIFPLCCLTPWPMGREFVHNCKHGILQYTVVRPITTIMAYICEVNDVYGEGQFETNVAFPYLVLINNCSQSIAMYCLVMFYRATRSELKPMKPIPKFLCIKAVIFFSFFQSVIIYFLVYYGFIKDIFGTETKGGVSSSLELSTKLQNFLICIEMFLAALAHHYSFSHKPYEQNIPFGSVGSGSINASGGGGGSWYSALLNMLDISDVQQDVSEHLGVVGSSLSRRLRGRTSYQVACGVSDCDNFGGSERQFLVPSGGAGSASNLANNQCYQSGLNYSSSQVHSNQPKGAGNRYGAFDTGISIVKPKSENLVETPNEGAPKVLNIFNQFQNSKSLNLALAKTPSQDNLYSMKSEATTSSTVSGQRNRKSKSESGGSNPVQLSQSNASDWLSTPDDELGIDVKGLSNDNINFNPNQKA